MTSCFLTRSPRCPILMWGIWRHIRHAVVWDMPKTSSRSLVASHSPRSSSPLSLSLSLSCIDTCVRLPPSVR